MKRSPAIGYLNPDVSGIRQQWHETQLRSLALRLGYDLMKICVLSGRTADPVPPVIRMARSTGAEAVFLPNAEHLGGQIPARLIHEVDQVIVAENPDDPFVGWLLPRLRRPRLFEAFISGAMGVSGVAG